MDHQKEGCNVADRRERVSKMPSWLRVPVADGAAQQARRAVRAALAEHGLNTVCQEAHCPNAGECWASGTATFMVLGAHCTRSCRFCSVETGDPRGEVDAAEPLRVAHAATALKLRHVVLTSVDRDDLPDGGAVAFRNVIQTVHRELPDASIEALVPDFAGNHAAIRLLASSPVDVLGHNVETIRRLTPAVRDRRAGYDQSLRVLAALRDGSPSHVVLKSSLMLGLGETLAEIEEALTDIRRAGVDAITIGQYMRPNRDCLPVERYVPPGEFARLEAAARRLGFRAVFAGPTVRSSYRARELLDQLCDVSST